MPESEKDYQPQRGRSPSYPYVDLEQAVALARKIFEIHELRSVPIEIALDDIGYSATSGSGARILGAFSQFGLFDIEGTGDEKRMKISERGKSIVWVNPSKPEAAFQALQEAALLPNMHSWVFDHFQLHASNLPSDAHFEYELMNEKDFTQKGAGRFIKEFKATYEYSKLNQLHNANSIEQENEDYAKSNSGERVGLPHQDFDRRRQLENEVSDGESPHGIRTLSTNLTQGKIAQLTIPENLNRKDFQILIKWLELLTEAALYQEEENDI